MKVLAIILGVVLLGSCRTAPESEEPPRASMAEQLPSNGDIHMQPYVKLIPLRLKYAGRFKPGMGPDFGPRAAVMKELLNEWDPVSCTEQEVLFLLGPPSEIRSDGAWDYVFDSGFVAVAYRLHMTDGVVRSIEHR